MYNEKIMTPIKEEIKEQKQNYFFKVNSIFSSIHFSLIN